MNDQVEADGPSQRRAGDVSRMAAGAGLRAGGQHSDTLHQIFASIPGLKVVAPATPATAKGLLLQAIADSDPVVFLDHMGLYRTRGPLPEGRYGLPIGKAAVQRRGDDVSLIAFGATVPLAVQAAERLAAEHQTSAEVIDLRTLSPLDAGTVAASVERTGRAVVIDESPPGCSMASELAATITEAVFDQLRAPVARITAARSPVPFSPPLEDAYLPSCSPGRGRRHADVAPLTPDRRQPTAAGPRRHRRPGPQTGPWIQGRATGIPGSPRLRPAAAARPRSRPSTG